MRIFFEDVRFIAGWASLVGLIALMHRMYRVRKLFRGLEAYPGVKILPHSFLFGHLVTLGKAVMKHKVPSDIYPHFHYFALAKEYPEIMEAGVLYLDIWPLWYPLMVVLKPGMTQQFTVSPSLPKAVFMAQDEFKHFTGGRDIISSQGELWKEQHALFAPGFGTKNVLSMMPWFIEEMKVFRERLFKFAETGETVKLENVGMDLTLDIIARAIFNLRTKAQEGGLPQWLLDMKQHIKILTVKLDLRKTLNPLNPLRHFRYNRSFRRAVEPMIEQAFRQPSDLDGPQSIMALAIRRIVRKGQEIPQQLLDDLVINVKMFLFAGHVTTTLALTQLYFLLSKHPEKLAKMREEHDQLLGRDPTRAAEVILADPSILNRLVYTGAALKESMRLWPPLGGSTREPASADHVIRNPETGVEFPSRGFVINAGNAYIMRDASLWHRTDEFLPERFLVRDPEDPLYPPKNAWLPFGSGPRSCIAQELSQIEIRLAAAMTMREIDIESMYPKDAVEYLGVQSYTIEDRDDVSSIRLKDAVPVRIHRRKTGR